MARKPREESPDAIFHVYSRGNYRQAIFDDPGACDSFLTSIQEITLRAGWHVFTYAIMPNHFHLMLRTPRANIARGMHLLLSGFAVRFNGIRDEHGHVFQGRYNAKCMPVGMAAGRLFDYINLNRVRKGLLTVDQLAYCQLSGVWGLCHPHARGELRQGEGLVRFIGYPDNSQGWENYKIHLKKVSGEDPDADIFDSDWEHARILEARESKTNPKGRTVASGLTEEEVTQLEQQHSEETFERLLLAAGRTPQMVEKEHGLVPWKLELAAQMFRTTTVTEAWVVRRLNAGSVGHFTKILRNGVRPQ